MRGWPVHRPTHAPATTLKTNGNSAPHKTKKTKSALILGGKNYHRHSGIFISRKRKENIRNLRRKAGMTSHWRECEAPLRRTQRDGANETILSGCFPSRLSPRRMSGTTTGGFFHTLSCGQHMLPQRLPVQPQKNPPSSSFRNLPRQRAGTSPAPKKPPSVQTSAPKSQFKPPCRTSPAPSGQNPLPIRRTGEKSIFAQFHPFHPFWRYNMP